jgi:hypothetical protein
MKAVQTVPQRPVGFRVQMPVTVQGEAHSIVWHADDSEQMGQLLNAWSTRFADPHLPRTLGHQLRAAGFQVERPEVLVRLNPEYDANTCSVANGEIMADYAVTKAASRVTRPTPGPRISASSDGTGGTSSA